METSSRIAPLIERLSKPISSLDLKLSRIGLFSLPPQYTSDLSLCETSTTIEFLSVGLAEGVHHPRVLSERELWEEEYLKQQKGKKKGTEPTPEEQKKIDYFDELRAKDQARLALLTPAQKRFDEAEDPQKMESIQWIKQKEEDEGGEEKQELEKPSEGEEGIEIVDSNTYVISLVNRSLVILERRFIGRV